MYERMQELAAAIAEEDIAWKAYNKARERVREISSSLEKPEIMDVATAAKILSMTPANIRYLVSRKRIAGVKKGKEWKLESDSVLQYSRKKKQLN